MTGHAGEWEELLCASLEAPSESMHNRSGNWADLEQELPQASQEETSISCRFQGCCSGNMEENGGKGACRSRRRRAAGEEWPPFLGRLAVASSFPPLSLKWRNTDLQMEETWQKMAAELGAKWRLLAALVVCGDSP